MRKHYWSGVCRKPRIPAIDEITHTVDAYGIILNATRFSDVSLSLMVEIPAGKTSDLYARLNQLMRMDGFDGQDDAAEGDSLVFCRSRSPIAPGI